MKAPSIRFRGRRGLAAVGAIVYGLAVAIVVVPAALLFVAIVRHVGRSMT